MYGQGWADSYFPPMADVGKAVMVWSQGAWYPFRVLRRTALPRSTPMRNDFGAINANANAAKTSIANFQLYNNQLAQFRCQPIDPVEIELYQLAGNPQWTVRSVLARVDRLTEARDPYMESSEHAFIGFNGSPAYTIYNTQGFNLAQSVVEFWGYRFDVEQLQNLEIAGPAWNRVVVDKSQDNAIVPIEKWVMAEAVQSGG